jgi:hypothetical protein
MIFPDDIAAIAAGGALEQIADRRADPRLSVVLACKMPIVLI